MLWRMSSATAADYGWIRSSDLFAYAIEVGYTLTLVRGLSPEEVLRVMGAEPLGSGGGVDVLIERQHRLLDSGDYWDDSFIAGACTVPGEGGDWTLVLHFDGGTGMRTRFLEALSEGTRVVKHSSNGGKPIHLFYWYEDGELRTTFEWPTTRTGSTPDELVPVMREVGFELAEDGDGDYLDEKAAVFALAERLTGMRVTEELLRQAEFRMGHVPEEPAPQWSSIVIDIPDANGGRFYKEVTREQVEHAMEHHRPGHDEPIQVDLA